MQEYLELLKSPGHWLFELTLIAIFDILIGAILWPRLKEILDHIDKHK